jgi:methyl-accepting chemotaxis protein
MSETRKYRSIKTKIRSTLLVPFAVMLLLTSVYLTYSQGILENKVGKDLVIGLADSYFDNINTLMLTNQMASSEIARQKVLSTPEVVDARIVRGAGITKFYGEGADHTNALDEWDRRGLAGESVLTFRNGNKGRILTIAIPMLAAKDYRGINCLSCHTVEENSVLGVIRVDYSMASLNNQLGRDLWTTIIIITAVMAATLFLITLVLGRTVSSPLETLTGRMRAVAEGRVDYSENLDIRSNDEIGNLSHYFNKAIKRFGGIIEEIQQQSQETQRLKTALDNVSSSVMVADTENAVIYMNRSAQELFNEAENDIRTELPGFSAEGLLGDSIDRFHSEPGHQQSLLARLDEDYISEFNLGGHTLSLVANPVIDETGERLGTAIEWTDRTAEVNVEREIAEIITAANAGNLNQRILLEGKQGFFAQLSNSVNSLLDVTSSAINEISTVVGGLSRGDLKHNIEGNYQGEFGNLKSGINQTLDKLNDIVSQIRDASDFIKTTAAEIAFGNSNLSARTEQEAISVEQTASSIEQLSSAVKQNADNANQANELALNARQIAEKGGDVVGNAIAAMGEIQNSSEKIAAIIGVIDDIAFQTNLLALNASVEAARAGEQGRGFAVVATEVRNLAQRSAASAKEIKELINESVHKVKTGSDLVDESGQTLEEIVTSVKKVGNLISEIATASQQQMNGISLVNNTISKIDEATQQNAALAEETAAASTNAEQLATRMADLVEFFNLREE